jgi:hypothetical protein
MGKSRTIARIEGERIASLKSSIGRAQNDLRPGLSRFGGPRRRVRCLLSVDGSGRSRLAVGRLAVERARIRGHAAGNGARQGNGQKMSKHRTPPQDADKMMELWLKNYELDAKIRIAWSQQRN